MNLWSDPDARGGETDFSGLDWRAGGRLFAVDDMDIVEPLDVRLLGDLGDIVGRRDMDLRRHGIYTRWWPVGEDH